MPLTRTPAGFDSSERSARIGGLSVEVIRSVLDAADDPDNTLHNVLGAVQRSLDPTPVADVLAAAQQVGHPDVDELLPAYRRAAEELAALEVAWLRRYSTDTYAVAERSVVGTVFGDALFTAVRREAQRVASNAAFGRTDDG